jgi:hypothetical protein
LRATAAAQGASLWSPVADSAEIKESIAIMAAATVTGALSIAFWRKAAK